MSPKFSSPKFSPESKFALREKIVEKKCDVRTGREGDVRLEKRPAVIVLELQRK